MKLIPELVRVRHNVARVRPNIQVLLTQIQTVQP